MTINEICNMLRTELFNNNYKYGFVVDNHKYTPNMDNGFDSDYYNLFQFESSKRILKEANDFLVNR